MLYARKIAQGKGIVILDEAKANSAAMSAWIDANRGKRQRKRSPRTRAKERRSRTNTQRAAHEHPLFAR
jgi:DNA topoisomerase-3